MTEILKILTHTRVWGAESVNPSQISEIHQDQAFHTHPTCHFSHIVTWGRGMSRFDPVATNF